METLIYIGAGLFALLIGFLLSQIKNLALAGDESYTPIYLEFRGHEHFEEVDGYQAEYDFQVHLSEVKSYVADIPVSCK